MAHFAEIINNKVKKVIVINNEILLDNGEESEAKGIDFCESLFAHRNWVQTSYNGNIRYNFAGVGYTWDSDNDAFYAPQPFPSWSLNENYIWQAPVPYPDDGNIYNWNEDNQSWDLTT
jgi:hypothetical protein